MPDPRNRLKWNATCKAYPAISDLQAVKDSYSGAIQEVNKDCSAFYTLDLPVVGAGELRVITNISAANVTSMCDIFLGSQIGGATVYFKVFYSVPADTIVSWDGMIVLVTGEQIRAVFKIGGAADTVNIRATGYTIGEY